NGGAEAARSPGRSPLHSRKISNTWILGNCSPRSTHWAFESFYLMTMQAAASLAEKKSRPSVAWRPRRAPQPISGALHVEVLPAGAHAWNKWRREHPGVIPVLNDLKMTISDRQFGPVQGGPINLSRAELCRAQLDQATLVEANLMGALLTEA